MFKTKDQRLVKLTNGHIITIELCLTCPHCVKADPDISDARTCTALGKFLPGPRDIDPGCKLISPGFFAELEKTVPDDIQTLVDGGCEVILTQELLPSGCNEYPIYLLDNRGMQFIDVFQSQEVAEKYLENLELYIQWKRQEKEAPIVLKTIKF